MSTSWAQLALESLKQDRPVTVRPRGGSMRGRIEDGERVRLEPCRAEDLAAGDVVLVRMGGNFLLHAIVSIAGDRYLIGNNIGGINGWAERSHIFGVAVDVEGRPLRRERAKERAVNELVDIGVNLTHRSFDRDRGEVIDRAREAGVRTLVITGTTVSASRSAAWLAKSKPGVLYATAGVHPHHAKDCGPSTLADLRALAKEREVVAVGECGLDFNRNFSPPAVQERWFEAQLELAAELSLPVFMHERDASARFTAILAAHRPRIPRGVVHCFTGTEAELETYLQLDLHIGITGWICDERRGRHLHALVRRIPLSRLMLETDAPFLLPRTRTGGKDERRNEPSFLPDVLETVARALDRPPAEVARETTKTARAFFALD